MSSSSRLAGFLFVLAAMLGGYGTARAQAAIEHDDAFVVATADGWTIGSSAIRYTLGFDTGGTLVLRDLRASVDTPSLRPAVQRDGLFRIDGREMSLTRSDTRGFRFNRADTTAAGGGVQLRLTFESAADGVQATRVYAAYPGVAAVEVWTELVSTTSDETIVSEMVTLQFVVDGNAVTTVRGLEAPEDIGGSFSVERRALGGGAAMAIEAGGRSTQYALPLASLGSGGATVFTGLLWSGSWRMDLVGQAGSRTEATRTEATRTEATLSLGETATTLAPNRPVTFPHAIVGVVTGDDSGVAPALHRFIVTALRGGRPLAPLVTHNTWFVNGTRITAESIARDMTAAAEAGAEVFQLDAGWYQGAGEHEAFDFSSGLGNYTVDPEKFPDGLRPLGDRARSLGMRFGVWVEPERVDLRTVGRPGLVQEAWLAKQDGLYQPGTPDAEARTALLDLGNPAARNWVLARLTTLIEEERVDYLKWDSNFWVNNNRPINGRGPSDGNFLHVTGLYQVLAALKERFPSLIIENCAGGGNRLDLGLMRYTDAGWMDDRTAPSSHVRHNLQGLVTFLPPAYLLSYLISHGDETMHGGADLTLYARSRMPGVFGLSFASSELDDRDYRRVREQTELWKRLRPLQSEASALLLTEQVAGPASPPWDALLLLSASRDEGLIYAYQNDGEVDLVAIRLRGLDPTGTYRVESFRSGEVGVFSGASLMEDGVEVSTAEDTSSHMLRVTRVVPTLSRH